MKRSSPRIIESLSLCCLISFSAVARASDDRWEPIGPTGEAGNITALAIDPNSPATIYAGTSVGIYKTTDGGSTWAAASSGLSGLNIHGVALSSSGLFALTARALFRSTDGAATWRSVLTTNASFRAFAVFSSTVYASTARCVLVGFDCSWTDGALYRSINGGATWSVAGLSGDVVTAIAIDPISASTVFAGVEGAVNRGVYKSTDGGVSFASSSSGLKGSYVFEIRVSKILPSTVYAKLETGVRRSTDGGASWASANDGLPYGSIALALDPTSSTTLYAGTDNAGVFKTTDGGDHWSVVGTGLTDPHVTSVAVDPASPSAVYAGTFSDGVFKITQSASSTCSSGPTTLCLNSGRFQVDVRWIAVSFGSGGGRTVPLTGDTGAFWFFSPSNLELMVKVLDGRGINGHFWFFYGALSDVAYTITVTDTESGRVKTYTNPQGRLSSAADTETF
jgi:photosystem II stability/assembly factor-like uncharacterized protein